VILYGISLLPAPGDSGSPAWRHVSPRFIHRALQETGQASPVWAVLSDYRGFDLLALNFIFFAAALFIVILPASPRAFPLFLSLVGQLASLSLGFFCLKAGSNFLDYEPLAGITQASSARVLGSTLLGTGFLFSLLGAGSIFYGALRIFREGSIGRS
jgi:hypothetical protein